jgi:hypothetical protein
VVTTPSSGDAAANERRFELPAVAVDVPGLLQRDHVGGKLTTFLSLGLRLRRARSRLRNLIGVAYRRTADWVHHMREIGGEGGNFRGAGRISDPW